MKGMFDRKITDSKSIQNLKEMFIKKYDLPGSTTLSIAELSCHEPNCPPIETVITARSVDGSIKDWRISKSVIEIKQIDLDILN